MEKEEEGERGREGEGEGERGRGWEKWWWKERGTRRGGIRGAHGSHEAVVEGEHKKRTIVYKCMCVCTCRVR